ncbi:MAG: hypothetical protein KIT31_43310, partial [Deltaproteobacteria bacterium]|nr:hypothetical protein [Deltaproteobacteria bacterium]
MPPLSKPYRVAFLVPDLALEGVDAAYEAEAALLLWAACIDVCQRHAPLAVYDAESTPLFPLDGHFEPHRAMPGASPTDAFYGSTRRDELLWLELALPKGGVVKLHALARDGQRQSFEALGRNLGDQIHQVFAAWLAARKLGTLARRFDAMSIEDFLGAVRVLGPILVEQARSWTPPHAAQEEASDDGGPDQHPSPADDAALANATVPDGLQLPAAVLRPRGARAAANRLPPTLRVPALRVLELALREELGDLILVADPDHPQALFARYLASAAGSRDTALLRRVIATAPGWARPYTELAEVAGEGPSAPTHVECAAGAAIAALVRPGQLTLIESAARFLREDGRVDEAVRLAERAARIHDTPLAHLALLQQHRATERVGAWLAQAQRASFHHGCPMDAFLPWYPDQILIDLSVADALLHAGRLDEAIALRANRLEGREAAWPRHTRILQSWRKEARVVAWSYAREGYFRGDPGRAVEGFGRVEPNDAIDLAIFIDALVALGRAEEVPLVWAHFGLGRGYGGPVARLAAARGMLAAGEWRRGLEELWRVELCEPGRDEQVAISRIGLLLSCMPIDVAEAALGERVAIGAHALARRMARDIADFVPAAGRSSIVTRALGKLTAVDVDAAAFAGFPATVAGKAEIDAMFAELAAKGGASDDVLVRADRLVERWAEVVFAGGGEDAPAALAQAATYVAAQALARYLAATT